MTTQQSGYDGTPIKLRTNRQTEEQERVTPRNRQRKTSADDDWTYGKMPNSAYRYDRPQRPTAILDDPKKTRTFTQRRFDRTAFVIWACLLFIIMVGGWWLFSTLSNWWTGVQDDWKYGNPRTYQTDQFTGQGDSPDHPDHFIVVNSHGQVTVVQLNPQHPQFNHTYDITTTDPKTPVSLSFRQIGHTLAMFVLIGDTSPYTVELVSDGKQQFVSPH